MLKASHTQTFGEAMLKKSLLAGTAVLASAIFGNQACKSTGASTSAQSAAIEPGVAGGLDVNDVSVLLPLPQKIEATNQMIALSLLTEAGHPLMSEAVHKDIIDHFKYTAKIDGVDVALNSGADFKGANPNDVDENGNSKHGLEGSGPFDNYTSWKIVAMRFDPCAPTPEHNRHGSEGLPPVAFDAAVCQPQLRLTTQPITTIDKVGRILFEPHGDGFSIGKPVAADFAIHMLFNLSPQQSQDVYRALVDFKKSCGNLTTSVPLGVHPCLAAEKLAGKYPGDKTQQIVAIIKKYALVQSGAAAMASRNSTDPWLFMNGLIQDGHFVHLPIDAVRKSDQEAHRNKQGKVLEPFSNGYYEMASFKVVESGTRPERVSPKANPSKVNIAIDAEFNLGVPGERRSLIYDAATAAAILHTVNTVEHPGKNDFFSTDCVTCHAASNLGFGVLDGLPKGKAQPRVVDYFPYNVYSGDPINAATLIDKANEPAFYKASPGYTNIIDRINMTRSLPGTFYGFLHFGYLGVSPVISQRTANESAKVAKAANDYYGQHQDPALLCPTEPLRQCLADPYLSDWIATSGNTPEDMVTFSNLVALRYCMLSICPERAASLTPLTPDFMQPKTFLASREIKRSVNGIESDYSIPKGTRINGFKIRNAAQPNGKSSYTFLTPRPVEVHNSKGEKGFIRTAFELGDGEGDDAFVEGP